VTSIHAIDGIYLLGWAVESIRNESGLATMAFDPLSPLRIGRRIEAEFFSNSLGELIRAIAFVIEISSLWK